ncbi:MAG: DUF1624 domain-containing protein [Oscillospiraceae bacterium]|nr:DUF1624 domain-containing protein [Oscillospiraceae bacterium]
MRERIWELDAFRGLCILCVVIVHTVFDLRYFVGLQFSLHPVFQFIMDYGGVLFVILSGVCVTLGSRSVRRGLIVLACGMAVTGVTEAMIALGMADRTVRIQFGVLHLLGVGMIVYPLYRRLPTWAIAAMGAALVALGYWFTTFLVECPYLFVLGLRAPGFAAGDYFPLCPQLGWFMLGTVLGRTAYRNRRTLLPRVPADRQPIRFLSACGRHSLWIYLAHQPVVYGILMAVKALIA